MHLSGVLVIAEPGPLPACRQRLEALPGVEVHHEHRETGRMIAVVESEDLAGQEQALRSIQILPGVRLAALVEHRPVADDTIDGASADGPSGVD